ncbi:DUF6777 domain-containing protein [Streptomyces sp. NPDC021093]|uniref:DUF6777 domain-containing protein n=1 Tax=Streptomyces sp. NPDC021093 TaxID=3365112 RepID=UPI0037B87520
MHSSTRRHAGVAAVSVLALGLLATGCGSGGTGPGDTASAADQDVLLQPVAAQGPDPFTQSTAKTSTPLPSTTTAAPTRTASAAPSATARSTHRISGGTPGLYGGTQSLSSCDVEQQVRYLTGSNADRAKARAFAEASRIDPAAIPGFLRGLTPVVLRVDTRVTNHGFSNGSATSFQSVLQAGTAVMVDANGMPRVRCACGNPLLPPTVVQGTVSHRGQPWTGYRPAEVVVVTPAPVVVNNLTIVNIVNNTWIERETGSDGENDRIPDPDDELPPPPGPDDLRRSATDTPADGDRDQQDTDGGTTPGTSESGTGTPSDRDTSPSTGPSDPATDTSTPAGSGTDPGTDPSEDQNQNQDQDQSQDPSGSTTSESTAPGTSSSTAPLPPPTTPCPTPSPDAPVTGVPGPVPPGCPTTAPAPPLPSDPDREPDTAPGPDGV